MSSYALRRFLRSFRTTLPSVGVAVVSLSLAIGTTATVLLIVDRLTHPKPVAITDPARVVRIGTAPSRTEAEYDALAENVRLSAVVAESGGESVLLEIADRAELARAQYVTGNYFQVLGTAPFRGRLFDPRTPEATVLLSHTFWTARLGASPDVIGSRVSVSGRPYTIDGVVAPGFRGAHARAVDLWLPATEAPRTADGFWIGPGFFLVARVADGVPLAQAEEEIRHLYRIETLMSPEARAVRATLTLEPLHVPLSSRLRKLDVVSVSFAGAGLAIFLIACMNVSALLLLRALARRHDTAVRMYLGATRARLLRGVILEALLLSACASAGALLVMHWTAGLLGSLLAGTVPSQWSTLVTGLGATDIEVLRLLAIMSGLATLVTAGAPLALVWTVASGAGRRGSGSPVWVHQRLHGSLVTVQVALTFVLLVVAGLFARTFVSVTKVEHGFDATDVVIVSLHDVDFRRGGYDDRLRGMSALQAMTDAAGAIDGVSHVARSSSVPIGRLDKESIAWRVQVPPGRSAETIRRPAFDFVEAVSPDYFELLRIPLRRGRYLSASDTMDQEPVAVVNERIVREFFSGRDPLGECLELAVDAAKPGEKMWPGVCRRIVGVVASVQSDVRPPRGVSRRIGDEDRAVYVPESQWPGVRYLLIRTRGDSTVLAGAIGARLQRVASDAGIRHFSMRPLSQHRERELQGPRLAAMTFGAWAIVALLFVTAGTYALVAVGVRQRTRDIGVRMALGATPARIALAATVRGMTPIGLGVLLGLGAAIAVSRVLEATIADIGDTDLLLLGATASLLMLVGAVACLPPSRAAMSVDPAVQLRHE